MDLFKTKEECQLATITYKDYMQYKEYYNVLDSWEDITIKILDSYTKPKIRHYTSPIKESEFMIKSILNTILKDPPRFYRQNKDSLRNSLYYMYYKYGSAYYARIRNNRLIIFAYIWNPEYENTLYKYLYVDPSHNIKYKNKKKWKILGSMVRVFEKKYSDYGMDFYYSHTKYLLQELCSDYKINDCDLIIAHKDNLVIKKDLSEACEEIVGNEHFDMESKFKFSTYSPIYSFCWNPRYADYPLITPDDVIRIYKLYTPPDCKNIYEEIIHIPWNEKKSTAVFRGSYTGSSANINTNPRLKISMLNYKWKSDDQYNQNNKIDGVPYLDAGITSKGGQHRGRKEIHDKYIRFVNQNQWKYLLVAPLSHDQQKYYKYILYIEGNVSAYRGAFLFSLKSVVLWVKSKKYYLWFEPCLKDMINCVFIESDLSNLAEKIEWLKRNDADAKKIAEEGYSLYKTFLTKTPLLEYASTLINLTT